MGGSIDVRCPCGYHREDVMFGGGKHPLWRTHVIIPGSCRRCHEVVEADIPLNPDGLMKDRLKPKCPKCNGRVSLFIDPTLRVQGETRELPPIIRWGRISILTTGLECQVCGKAQMTFTLGRRNWD